MKSIAVGIVGASGYSGEVLIEILTRHPAVSSITVASRSLAGQRVGDCLPRLRGVAGDLTFVSSEIDELGNREVAVWFLALPHGVAAEYAVPLQETGSRVIDLSADYRLSDPEVYADYYGQPHPQPELLATVPYVIPELATDYWKEQRLIACPGCYPTSVLMPLIPLLREGILDGSGIVINAVSGVSGAGKKASELYSFCERDESVVAYGLGKHRHLSEIEEQLAEAAGRPVRVQFTPHLVPMIRGIAATIVAPSAADIENVYDCWESAYGQSPAVHLLPAGKAAETGHVVGQNRIDISATKDERTGNLIITSAIDNLLKGAGGQAVQIMNIAMGYPELAGMAGKEK